MNISDIVVILILAAWGVAGAVHIRRSRARGSCTGCCAGCSRCCHGTDK